MVVNEFLAFNPLRSRLVEVSLPQPLLEDGTAAPDKVLTVKVRQPTVDQRGQIFSEIKISKAGEVAEGMSFRRGALAIIHCVVEPGTDKPIFDISDLDVLMHNPSGSWADKLANAVFEIMTESSDAAKK